MSLTINERQKKDSDFSDMLDSVRRGAPTEKTLETLRGRVTDIPIPQLYSDLQSLARPPFVCFLPENSVTELTSKCFRV